MRLYAVRMNTASDSVMEAAEYHFEKSGLFLDQVGLYMGYPIETARKSVWQFIHGTNADGLAYYEDLPRR